MLDKDALSQLKGLKTQMEAEKEHTEAVVKGTQSRYGFAVLDDGREIFIPPHEMLKVFPRDRVKICIRPAKGNKTVADIERLVDSPLAEFTGRCVRKGKAIFVEPDLSYLNRWLFIPPHARDGAKEGDYLRCAILRHPIKDGKPQAKVLELIGDADTAGVENRYTMAKFGLSTNWSAASEKDLAAVLAEPHIRDRERRQDLSGLEFVSIDAAKTQDIDDALYAEVSNEGWTLYVAIADPSSYVSWDSDLCREIAARGTSVYFHGDIVPMLPEALSQDSCALAEGEERPALVCKVAVSESGELGSFEFIEAIVCSRAKLSYYAVDRYLSGQADGLMSHSSPLEALYQVFRALKANREQNGLEMEDRQEYRWVLNDQRQIESIETYEKLQSQRLVEECMIAANRCAAQFLSVNAASGPFVVHRGFRSDRLKEVNKFLTMHVPDVANCDPTTVCGYREIMRRLGAEKNPLPLRPMVNRLLCRAELSSTADVHMGLTVDCYTNCTSPLRKFTDFLVHLQIKSLLGGERSTLVTNQVLAELSASIANNRAATREAERWLVANYLQRLNEADTLGVQKGRVVHVNSSGFGVRLEESGLEGFLDLRKDQEKFSYDKWTASLTSTTRRFQIQQQVEVEFSGIGGEPTYQALFKLNPDCGLKPLKIAAQ